MRRFILAALMTLVSTGAWGQARCAPHAAVLDQLMRSHGESPVGMGLSLNGQAVEILASPDGKTWTAVVTDPSGHACVVGAGTNWERMEPAQPGEPS